MMLSNCLFLVVTAITVQASTNTRKRGLEHSFGYAHNSQPFNLASPSPFGHINGLQLLNYQNLHSNFGLHPAYQHLPPEWHNYVLPPQTNHFLPEFPTLILTNPELQKPSLVALQDFNNNYHLPPGYLQTLPVRAIGFIAIPKHLSPLFTPTPTFGAALSQPVRPPQPPQGLPAPAPALPTAPPAQQKFQPQIARIGSGSLGYAVLSNGLVALGSGSLGYSGPPIAPQNVQTNSAQSVVQTLHTAPQVIQSSTPIVGYGGVNLNYPRFNVGNPAFQSNLIGYNNNYGVR